MFARYLLSVCQCVIEDLEKTKSILIMFMTPLFVITILT